MCTAERHALPQYRGAAAFSAVLSRGRIGLRLWCGVQAFWIKIHPFRKFRVRWETLKQLSLSAAATQAALMGMTKWAAPQAEYDAAMRQR